MLAEPYQATRPRYGNPSSDASYVVVETDLDHA